MRKRIAAIIGVLCVCWAGRTAFAQSADETPPGKAAIGGADVAAVIGLIEKNYPGYQDKRRRFGAARIDDGTQRARARGEKAASDRDADAAIDDYLKTFEDGHLFVIRPPASPANATGPSQNKPAPPAPLLPPTQSPSARALSGRTFYLRVPSFMPEHKAALETLLKNNEAEIARRPFLIVDVRDNHGGADETFAPLLPFVYDRPIRRVGANVLATPDIAAAWERILPGVPDGETALRERLAQTAKKLRAASSGSLLPLTPDQTITLTPRPMPRRVAILINKGCVSSTEQFALDARPSRKVALIGQATYGALDYGDIRPFPLPSGRRILWMPTTRSRRLPQSPVDGVGVPPTVACEANPAPPDPGKGSDAQLDFALRYLESGGAPPATEKRQPR